MSLPSFLLSASVFICERVLVEKDEVISAIRLVDTFFVPAALPPEASDLKPGDPMPPDIPVISAYAVANFKAIPGYRGTHKADLKILNTRNEFVDLGRQIDQVFSHTIEDAPPSVGFIAQIKMGVRNTGNCYACLYLDGEEVARTPFTIALPPTPRQA